MHRQFFKIISQNPDYVKSHCSDRFNRFNFAICKWINQFKYELNVIFKISCLNDFII